jgi:hypothetical protein
LADLENITSAWVSWYNDRRLANGTTPLDWLAARLCWPPRRPGYELRALSSDHKILVKTAAPSARAWYAWLCAINAAAPPVPSLTWL